MDDEILVGKAASIQRCLDRVRTECADGVGFLVIDLSRQDAAILNILRACESALAMGRHLVRKEALGVPKNDGGVFEILHSAGWIDGPVRLSMIELMSFRDIAYRECHGIPPPVLSRAMLQALDTLPAFRSMIVLQSGKAGPSRFTGHGTN